MAGKAFKPVVSPPAGLGRKRPVIPTKPQPQKWTFSFRFWRQIEYFGLSGSNSKWFVSLLERLCELSKESVDDFRSNLEKQSDRGYRYHDISWTHKNIPIQPKELDWLSADYLNDPESYPMVQFQISMALGRVVGFWDENTVFNIVLLDPLHNIQPTKKFDYRVRPASPLSCVYTDLLTQFTEAKKHCTIETCVGKPLMHRLPKEGPHQLITLLSLRDEIREDAQRLIAEKSVESIEDLLEWGVIFLSDNKGPCPLCNKPRNDGVQGAV